MLIIISFLGSSIVSEDAGHDIIFLPFPLSITDAKQANTQNVLFKITSQGTMNIVKIPNPQQTVLLKVVFVGDSGVGKTSLLRREGESTFSQEHLATIGVDFRIKIYQVGKIVAKMQLWDTAGQERFRSIQKPYYKNSSAVCLCFSLSDRQSFDNLSHWVDEITNFEVKGTVYLIGCKSDLEAQVPTDQVIVFAEAHQLKYLQTSAKDNVGVSEAFKLISEESVQNKLMEMAFNPKEQNVGGMLYKQAPPNKKKTCC